MDVLLMRAYDLLSSNPLMGAAIAGIMVLAFLLWGVVSTSHRYR